MFRPTSQLRHLLHESLALFHSNGVWRSPKPSKTLRSRSLSLETLSRFCETQRGDCPPGSSSRADLRTRDARPSDSCTRRMTVSSDAAIRRPLGSTQTSLALRRFPFVSCHDGTTQCRVDFIQRVQQARPRVREKMLLLRNSSFLYFNLASDCATPPSLRSISSCTKLPNSFVCSKLSRSS